MPIDVHDEAPGPPAGSSGGSDPRRVASDPRVTSDQLRPVVVAVLRDLGVAPDHPSGQPISRGDAALTGDVDETELPQSITHPVIATGEHLQLALKKEGNRGRVITCLLGLLCLVLIGTIATAFRLPPEEAMERMKQLTDAMLLTVAAALVYYFGRKNT